MFCGKILPDTQKLHALLQEEFLFWFMIQLTNVKEGGRRNASIVKLYSIVKF
jgi:hypothetical protein